MPDDRDYWAQQRPDKNWEVKKEGSDRASAVFETQLDAWAKAKELAQKSKGEAYLKRRDGKIRERNTYGPDPRKTKG